MKCPCCQSETVERTDAEYVKQSRYPKHHCLECGNKWDAMAGKLPDGRPRSVWRKSAVFILDTKTREQRTYQTDQLWDFDEERGGYDFVSTWWSDGNAGCDCNRSLFFLQAGGEETPEKPECGDGRYVVLKIVDTMSHAVIYEESPPSEERQG